jgi:hypothetical protein
MLARRPFHQCEHVGDRKVSVERKTAVACAALTLFSLFVVTVQAATHMTNVAMFMADSVALASP